MRERKRKKEKIWHFSLIISILIFFALFFIYGDKFGITGNVIDEKNTEIETLVQKGAAITYSDNDSLKLIAEVNINDPSITLKWDEAVSPYVYIYKKTENDNNFNFNSPYAIVAYDQNQYVDEDVEVGKLYEYYVKNNQTLYNTIYGYEKNLAYKTNYIISGINIPYSTYRGKISLLIDEDISNDINDEIEILKQDLVGDGWQVITHVVPRSYNPPDVKQLILDDYDMGNNNLTAVYLIGHIAVPYSGCFVPDGHTPGHNGAWPADIYYGTMYLSWPDSITCTTSSESRTKNYPSDGKFDLSSVEDNSVQLYVGRADLSNFSVFGGRNEIVMTKQYINKTHNYKLGRTRLPNRAIVWDNLNMEEGFASSAYRLTNIVGFNNVSNATWDELLVNEYLFAYGCGGGSWTYGGFGETGYFLQNKYKAMFFPMFGSYFGDWDNENNYLRAALTGETYGLASFWSGRPKWNTHKFAMGFPLGKIFTDVSNDPDYYEGYYSKGAHISLIGDPTLRLNYISVPSNLLAIRYNETKIRLDWDAPEDNIEGYDIYVAENMDGLFTKLNDQFVTEQYFIDSNATAENKTYMVRAVQLTSSSSGTYYNPSIGTFINLSQALLTPLPITSEPSQTYKESGDIDFECNASSIDELVNITLNIWNITGKDKEVTNEVTGFTNSTRYTYVSIAEGEYIWGCKSVNINNIEGLSKNNSLNILSGALLMNISSPIEGIYNSDSIDINITLNRISSCSYAINDGPINNLTSIDGINFFNTQTFSNGLNSINITCNDTIGKINESIISIEIQSAIQNTRTGGGGGGSNTVRHIVNDSDPLYLPYTNNTDPDPYLNKTINNISKDTPKGNKTNNASSTDIIILGLLFLISITAITIIIVFIYNKHGENILNEQINKNNKELIDDF